MKSDNANKLDEEAFKTLFEKQCLIQLKDEEAAVILHSFCIKTFPKGSLLLAEGQIARHSYYIFKGCVREYYLIGNEERIAEFYLPGDSLYDNLSKNHRQPSKKYWECLEQTTVSVFPYERELEMYRRFPRLEKICRIETEKQFGLYRDRMALFMASSPEDRYLRLLQTRPVLLEKVPQYQLASYIGVKPESLSRIRGRLQGAQRPEGILK